MLDRNFLLMYYMVTGEIYKEEDKYKQIDGGVKYVKKSRGFKSIIEYLKSSINHHLSFHKNRGK
ncbi:MAG: hypothetical protein GX895_13245 [Clostridiales bacterium]|nr:hypothetical protein [Clostridiales bacterium]